MSTIRLHKTTTATPEQFLAGFVWLGASGHTYTFSRRPDGRTDLDAVVVREGKNLKGRILGLVLGTIGKRVLTNAFEHTVKAIEERAQQQGSLHPDRVAREGTIENGDRRGRLMDYRPGECRTY